MRKSLAVFSAFALLVLGSVAHAETKDLSGAEFTGLTAEAFPSLLNKTLVGQQVGASDNPANGCFVLFKKLANDSIDVVIARNNNVSDSVQSYEFSASADQIVEASASTDGDQPMSAKTASSALSLSVSHSDGIFEIAIIQDGQGFTCGIKL